MEKKINIAELLKDCPKGMELDCSICNGVKFIELDRSPNFPIVVRANNGYEFSLTKYGQVHNIADAKCVIFPKGKTTWEGFQRPFKDGDVIYTHTDALKCNLKSTFISIFKECSDGKCRIYAGYSINTNSFYSHHSCNVDDIIEQRLATEEEKQKLFQAIKDHGLKWNSETKTLEKLVEPKFKVGDIITKRDSIENSWVVSSVSSEYYGLQLPKGSEGIGVLPVCEQDKWELVPNKFDINTLKPFESRVLVRSSYGDIWRPAIYGVFDSKKHYHYVVGGNYWTQCIPYEGNEHLLETTNDCDEYYKNW